MKFAGIITLLSVVAIQATVLPRDSNSLFDRLKAQKAAPRVQKAPGEPKLVSHVNTDNGEQPGEPGSPLYESRIVGGSNAARGQYPWHVSIIIDSRTICGGSVISKDWVMTAGYCVYAPSMFNLVFGSVLSDGGESGSIVQLSREKVLHEDYIANNRANNVGLIKITQPLTFTQNIKPIRLPRKSQDGDTFEGRKVILTGFGRTSDAGQESISPSLKWKELEVIDNDTCKRDFGSYVYPAVMCTKATGVCENDFGNPLVLMESDGIYTQVGITSFYFTGYCERFYPSGYARVTQHLDWIGSKTGIAIVN